MKHTFSMTLVVSLFIVTSTQAASRGINYDPAHSSSYVAAQRANNYSQMETLIKADLALIKKLGFTRIKTFYSTYCTVNGASCLNITRAANATDLSILLGVYEFPAHPDWTTSQVNAAIAAANAYPSTVIGIIVGNEDAFDSSSNPIPAMQMRIVNDMKTIRKGLSAQASSIKVFTAQRQPDWLALAYNDPQGLLAATDVVGANIYPFWGNSPETGAAATIPTAVAELTKATNKVVIVTEEGWPSCGNNPNTQDKTIAAEKDYYTAWQVRTDTFDSYYFSAFDKAGSVNCAQEGDANNFFGLCESDGKTKDKSIAICN